MKLYFLSRSDCDLAEPDARFIDAVKAEMLRRPEVAEAASPAEADAILIQEEFAFREWRYIDRLLADPVIGSYPHKTYTINVDDAATGLLRGAYTALPQRRFNPTLHTNAPIIRRLNEVVLQRAGQPRPQPAYLAAWYGNPISNRLRTRLVELYGQSKTIRIVATDSWMNHAADEKRQYADLLHAGQFSLCPAGWGPTSLRLFESMAMGVAPVILADETILPPGPKWEDFSLLIPEAGLPRLEQELERHAHRYAEMGELAWQAWIQYFSPDRLPSYYADALLACMRRSNAGTGSKAQEVARWRSRQMYWSNQWTMPQRVGNRLRRMFG